MINRQASITGDALFPLFSGERPQTHLVLDWLKDARPIISADQSSIVARTTPRSLLPYKVASMPDELVADTTTGVTASAVAARAATRLSVGDANELKIEQRASHLSEIRGGAR